MAKVDLSKLFSRATGVDESLGARKYERKDKKQVRRAWNLAISEGLKGKDLFAKRTINIEYSNIRIPTGL